MASFNFDTWCTATKLTETSVDILNKEDLDTEEALQLLTPTDLEKLGLSIGQNCILEAVLKKLQKVVNEKPSPGDATGASDPITTKSLASDGGLEEILKKIESAGSLGESLLDLGSTDFSSAKPPALNTSTLSRLDNDLHVFLLSLCTWCPLLCNKPLTILIPILGWDCCAHPNSSSYCSSLNLLYVPEIWKCIQCKYCG